MFYGKGYPVKKIGDVIEKTISRVAKVFEKTDEIQYLDISSIDNSSKTVTGLTPYVLKDAPSRAQYVLKQGDIMYSTVRPNLQNIAINPYSDDNVVGSTGFCVLRCTGVTTGYMWGVINSVPFTEAMTNQASGANYPAVTDKVVHAYEIPVPPVEEQTAYEQLVKQSDKSKFTGFKSQFIEMFGMESDDMKRIDDIANICRGASPRPIAKYVTDDDDGVNWIKIGDVTEEDIYITHTAEKITKEGAKKSRAVEPGDFILSNSMSFGRPYLVGINGCVHDGWLIISDYQEYLDPLFFYYELRSDLVQRQFDGSANGSCVKNLNSDLVKKVKIHVPPKEQQMKFVEFAQQSDKSK